MWKVLIADDEPKLRRGMKASIGKLEEVTVVGEAEDGQMALEQATLLRPDILLIDIRMPFLNGLELIERLNMVSEDWIIVVVTGHDEFDYAQTALRLNVFDYLLKPVTNEELGAVIDRAKTKLSLRRASDKYTAWARDQLSRNMPALSERFLRSWVSGGMSRSEVEESFQFLGIAIAPDSTMILVRLAEKVAVLSEMKVEYRKLMILAMRSIAESTMTVSTPPLVFDDDLDTLIIIASFPSDAALRKTVQEIETEIRSSVHQVPLIAHKAVGEAWAVPECYADLSDELNERSGHDAFVLMAESYVAKHYYESDLSLERVSSELELSSGYLSRLMKQETGLSFVDFLTRYRVQKAAKLMVDPAAKVFEVAELVGYRDQHYFSRAFKRVLGVPPVEYRKGGL
jgi:two-component system, response regulator YesN